MPYDSRMKEDPNPWQCLNSQIIWSSHWFSLRQDKLRIQNGQTITYTYQDHPGAVMVVPITSDREVVMVHQYRYLVKGWCWEVPSGGRHDEESLEDCARRELAEETGYSAGRLIDLGGRYTSNAVSNECLGMFLALDLTAVPGALNHEPTELMSVHFVPLDRALAMVRTAEINDGQTSLALLLAAVHLRQLPDFVPGFSITPAKAD